MKKLFYTLLVTLFTLNISAQSVYIVAEDANAPDVNVMSASYSLEEIEGTTYAKAWKISGGTGTLSFYIDIIDIGKVSKRITQPTTDIYFKIVKSSSTTYTFENGYNNTYTSRVYTNIPYSQSNHELQTPYNINTVVNSNVMGYEREYVYTWGSFWNETITLEHIYFTEAGIANPTTSILRNNKEYVLTYDYNEWHFQGDELIKPNVTDYQLAIVEISDYGTINNDGNIEQNNSYGFFKEIVRTKTYTAAEVENWIWISSPYRANIVIKDANGNQLSHAYYFNDGDNHSGDYLLKYYDTQAASIGSENTWIDSRVNILEANKGYILGINPDGLTAPFTVTITSTPNQIIDTYTRIGFGHNNNYTSSIDAQHSNLHLVGTGLYNLPRGLNFGGKVAHICIPKPSGYSYKYQFNMSESDYQDSINYLKPYTAFFMQYAGDYTFHNYNGTEIAPRAPRRSANVAQEMEIYELSLNGETTTIMMDADGSEGYTINEDFMYFTHTIDGTEIAYQFYTFDGNDQLSFNHRKNENQTITLGGRVATTGEYTISLNGINTKAQSVTLFDAIENTTTELTANNYTFTSEAGSIAGRFTVTFSFAPSITTDIFATEANQLVVLGDANNCTIKNLIVGEQVMIFDAMGRLIYNAQTNATTINLSLTAGTYIVRQTNNFAKFVIR